MGEERDFLGLDQVVQASSFHHVKRSSNEEVEILTKEILQIVFFFFTIAFLFPFFYR